MHAQSTSPNGRSNQRAELRARLHALVDRIHEGRLDVALEDPDELRSLLIVLDDLAIPYDDEPLSRAELEALADADTERDAERRVIEAIHARDVERALHAVRHAIAVRRDRIPGDVVRRELGS
jgi:hypothetical protein